MTLFRRILETARGHMALCLYGILEFLSPLVFGFYVAVKLTHAIPNDMSQVIICLKIYEHQRPNQVS